MTAASATAIEITWAAPASPNGLINRYFLLTVRGNVTEVIHEATRPGTFTWTGRSPYTVYSVLVRANNAGGAANSDFNSVRTKESGRRV